MSVNHASSAAAIFTAPNSPLEVCRIDVPALAHGQILIRITACTLCGSDLHSFEGRRNVNVPTILGHEIVGRIAAFGPDAARIDIEGNAIDVGDRVTWAMIAHCRECFYCRRDLPQKCERSVKYGHERATPGHELTGGLAEYCVLVANTSVIRLPDNLSDAAAAPASCATATIAAALEAITPAGTAATNNVPLRNSIILIAGAGMLGLTACAMARTLGAAAVICSEPDSSRRFRSHEFGATHAVSPEQLPAIVQDVTSSHGADAIIELSGSNRAFDSTLPLLRLGGTMALVGAVFPDAAVAVPMERIVRRNLCLIGIHNYKPAHLRTAVRFLAAHPQYPFASLIERWFPLSEANDAFAAARQNNNVRVGITAA